LKNNLASVDVHRVVGAVAHQVGIVDVVLDHAAAQNDDSAFEGFDGHRVQMSEVLNFGISIEKG
jgi:hypothetical protein